jgi:hypothetical protein
MRLMLFSVDRSILPQIAAAGGQAASLALTGC